MAGRQLIKTNQETVRLPDGCESEILEQVETDEQSLAADDQR